MELIFRWYEEASKEMINSVDIHNGEHPDCYIIATNGKLELYATREGSGGYDELVSDEAMQFTGLTDKNGKDIYVGDRVKVWNGNKSFIGHDGFQFTVGKQQRRMDANEARDMEVIGNIYQSDRGNNND